MKTILYSLAFITLLVGCQSSDQPDTTHTDYESTTSETTTKATEEGQSTKSISMKDDFQNLGLEGTIDGKYEIFMELFKSEESITGEMLYIKSEKPFSIEGSESNGSWTISEYADGNQVTGIFEGKLAGNIFKGTWTNPKNKKTLPFELEVVPHTMELYKVGIEYNQNNPEIARNYSDGSSNFTFEKVSDTEYLFSFEGTWGGNDTYPTIHTGDIEGVAILKEGKLYFQGDDDFTKNCSFIATFKDSKMFIKSESYDTDCGFGANVTFGTSYTSE